VMTAINRPNYLQQKKLADAGQWSAAHIWDHHMVTKYKGDDWNMQLLETKGQVRKIIGKPDSLLILWLWNLKLLQKLKKWISNGIYTLPKKSIAATLYYKTHDCFELGNERTITRHWSYFSKLVSNLQKKRSFTTTP
jgi:hypothetical protein